MSNLELPRSYKALCNNLVLPSATTLSIICRREYALTVDTIKRLVLLRNKVRLASDGWTSTHKQAITSVIAYYIDRNWALREVQLAFDEVYCLFCSRFESQFRMIGQGPTFWSKGSCTFEGCAGSFWAYGRPFTWYYNGKCFLKLVDAMRAAINTWGLWNWVAGIEELHTLHGARHTAGFRCIHEKSRCEGRAKSWEAHQHDQQFRENESMDTGKRQRLRKEGNARINKVSAMRPGLAKISEKVHISWYFDCPEADLHIAENACCINYANTWSPKRVHWLSKS